jgi:hypothetical protein
MSNNYANKIMSCSINAKQKSDIDKNENNLFNVKGKIKINNNVNNNNLKIVYWAANPPDYLQSFNGSGLPYPNPDMAYQNTPNLGVVNLDGDSYSFDILYPNSYYTELGTVYNEPRVHIKLCTNDDKVFDIQTIILKNPIPYRSLAYASHNLTIPRTTGNCSDKSNVQLACSTYGTCQNSPQTPQEVGEVVDKSSMPFFYTNFYQQQPNPLRSQEQILWESKFPDDKMKWFPNFWGNKPPQ